MSPFCGQLGQAVACLFVSVGTETKVQGCIDNLVCGEVVRVMSRHPLTESTRGGSAAHSLRLPQRVMAANRGKPAAGPAMPAAMLRKRK